MKNQINIQIKDQYGNTEVVSLDGLKDKLRDRRYWWFKLRKGEKFVTPIQADHQALQPAARLQSFKIAQLNHEQAIKLFNEGGIQKATII